jgi:hypothetical protein
MQWYWWIPIGIGINWLGAWAISWAYALWLWEVSCDVSFEGWIFWRGWFPIARFRLISRYSWYAKLWEKFYGMGLFGVIIHRDQPGLQDDAYVEKTIVHELRHNLHGLVLGILQWVAYGLNAAVLWAFTDMDPYRDVWFETDARRAADNWVRAGRPRRFDFGVRY